MVEWLGTSFVWVGLSEPLMLAYISQSTWVGKAEGGLGGASWMLMSRAVRQTRVATGGQASEHRARAMRVNMYHVVVRTLEGDAPFFVAADFFSMYDIAPRLIQSK